MSSYTAVIVEPRKHKALEFVLRNFLTNLSAEWNIIVFHGTENIEFVKAIILSLRTNRISMVNLHVRNLTLPSYSRLLTTAAFYEHIPTEMFLVFQTDVMIFAEQKGLINKFLHYDYVGAPWHGTPTSRAGLRVGNGGLSLRRKSKMLEIIRTEPYLGEPEDVYFCNSRVPLNVPPVDEAMQFSVEHIFHPTSFGCHKPWVSNHVDSLSKLYPGVIELQYLNKYVPPKGKSSHPLHKFTPRLQ
jgi:hypothetical protein